MPFKLSVGARFPWDLLQFNTLTSLWHIISFNKDIQREDALILEGREHRTLSGAEDEWLRILCRLVTAGERCIGV